MQATTMIGLALAGGALGLVMAAAGGGSLIGLVSELAGWRMRSAFHRNFGQQVARLTLFGALTWLCLLAAAALISLRSWPGEAMIPETAGEPEFLVLVLIVAAGGLFMAVSIVTAKALKRRPLGHCLIGFLGAVCLNAGLVWSLNQALLLLPGQAAGAGTAVSFLPDALQPARGTLLWPAVLQLLPYVLGGAGFLALLFVLLRRNRDVFGRDYYRFAVPYAAKWGLLFVLQAAGPLLGFFLSGLEVSELARPFWGAAAAAGAFLVGSAALSLAVIKSPSPLRLKGTMVAAFLSAWLGGSAALTCQVWLLWPLGV